ncbi:MAG: hypothetical protein NC429_04720 [Lachnospiraceae bacterium]|nr:hypothetical protein [Lachnospiraceae bacterium]
MKNTNIYLNWYYDVINLGVDTLNIDLKNKKEILELQNFFLICQRINQEGNKHKLNLNITCDEENVYRIKSYLYIVAKDKKFGHVYINGKLYNNWNDIGFYRRMPLFVIDNDNYFFLKTRVGELKQRYGARYFIEIDLYPEGIKELSPQELLISICINNLIGEVCRGSKNFSKLRREYFNKEQFDKQIEDMPFLALLIFSISNRTKNIDAIESKKKEIKKQTDNKRIYLTPSVCRELFPTNEDIEADIFNAWDISDGILELLENIVLHANRKLCSDRKNIINSGEGVFAMYLHKNDVVSDKIDQEFNLNSELFQRFPQYFRGYINEYSDGLVDEQSELKKYQAELLKKLKKGQYVEREVLEHYEFIRGKVEKRRKERQKFHYFWEIQIADFSGKYMCDVFRENLVKRKDEFSDRFNEMTVRSFFDPTKKAEFSGKTIDEVKRWEEYYTGTKIIKHYGLQIFMSIISGNTGSFTVKSYSEGSNVEGFYSNTGEQDKYVSMLPGTAYNILLPMKAYGEVEIAQNTFLNADINYHFSELDKLEPQKQTNKVINEFYCKLNEIVQIEEEKEKIIENLADILNPILLQKEIVVFDCCNIKNAVQFELFVKTLIFLIASKGQKQGFNNIAVINCETNDFVNFIRYFSICYDKMGYCKWMEMEQIYLCGKNSTEEFIVSGKNIQEMIGRVEKLAFSRRLYPKCIPMLTRMLKRRILPDVKSEKNNFSYTPFDLVIKNRNGETVFEQNVLKVLNQNIQLLESGCKIEPTHMRLGSKVHINAFYEAELLLFNNYYVNRFSYLLAEKIQNKIKNKNCPIWLIGYENYSEMLISRLKQYIQDIELNKKIHYSIYENSRGNGNNWEENFRYFQIETISMLVRENAQVFFIVPINSTLTTFNKLEYAIKRKMQDMDLDNNLNISGYFGIVQIRDIGKLKDKALTEMEEKYWESINLGDNCIRSPKLLPEANNCAYYIVLAKAKWENPLECEECYPQECLAELPLIETDKASVVPTQLIGLTESVDINETEKMKYDSYEKIDSIKKYFYYDHIERGANHYHIYVRTANYYIEHENRIRNWLKDKVKPRIVSQKSASVLTFEVLVNPLHFSNSAFVDTVNEMVFNGTSYSMRIEVGKEFRDNVETKFSDLKLLYQKLINMKIPAAINFHFVDDSINLGNTYIRMKHMVSSLFPQDAIAGHGDVKVTIFKSVIVLINRLSYASIRDYVSDIQDYFYFIDLRISSMRTHEDACYLCKEEKNAEKLINSASTNQMAKYWEQHKKNYRKKSLNEAKIHKLEVEVDKKYYERYYRRIYCAHYFNTEVTALGIRINNPKAVMTKVIELIMKKQKRKDFLEYLMSYLYVYCTPFMSYRKSIRESALLLIIILMEVIIQNETYMSLKKRVEKMKEKEERKELKGDIIQGLEISKPLIDKIWSDFQNNSFKKYDLCKLLMKLSAELKSNYILREDKIENIIKLGDGNEEEFYIYYTALMKKILTLNPDESKSARFDRMLMRQKMVDLRQNKKILKYMYMENTIGLQTIIKKVRDADWFESFYNDEIFKQILATSGIEEHTEEEFIQNLKEMDFAFTKGILEDYSNDTKNIPFYQGLCMKIGKLLMADIACCAVKMSEKVLVIDADDKVVYDNETTYKFFGEYMRDSGSKVPDKAIMRDMKEPLLMDTFYIDEKEGIAIVKYTILFEEGIENKQEVYFALQWYKLNEDQILQKLRLLLMFREEILGKLYHDFDNNIIQEWIEKNRTMAQLRKARSSAHTKTADEFDLLDVWTLSERFLFGDESERKKHYEEYEKKMIGCLLGLMMNIRIGRANVLLLSQGEFITEPYEFELSLRYLKEDILVLKKIYFYDKLLIIDSDGNSQEESIFPDGIYECILAKGKEKLYYNFKNYLLYFIFELFHSAVMNGKEEDGKVKVKVYNNEEYLFFENLLKDDSQRDNVIAGLRRDREGISLATICEFFIYNYENRNVKIVIEQEKIAIGIPIFKKQ